MHCCCVEISQKHNSNIMQSGAAPLSQIENTLLRNYGLARTPCKSDYGFDIINGSNTRRLDARPRWDRWRQAELKLSVQQCDSWTDLIYEHEIHPGENQWSTDSYSICHFLLLLLSTVGLATCLCRYAIVRKGQHIALRIQ